MVCNIRNFVFIYIVVVIYSTYTFAPWTIRPKTPKKNTYGTCIDWLFYYDFTDDNKENLRLASIRETEYDQDVSYFAAAYAYLLSTTSELFDINNFGPQEFCKLHTINYASYPFIKLKNAEFTCEGWIHLYLYSVESDNDVKIIENKLPDNYFWALDRDESMDNKISIWATLYFEHISSNLLNAYRTPREFCKIMGKLVMKAPLPKKFPFMTLNGTKMSCDEWEIVRTLSDLQENVIAEEKSMTVKKLPFTSIKTECYEQIISCGFSDNKSMNYQLVLSDAVDINMVNVFARNYINNIIEKHTSYLKFQKEVLNKMEESLRTRNLLHAVDRSTNDVVVTLEAPKEFCESWSFSETELLIYFGRQ